MNKEALLRLAADFTQQSAENRIPPEVAFRKELAGVQMYQAPLAGFAAADDPFFADMANERIASEDFRSPSYWLPDGRTVISFFFPFTSQIIESNRQDKSWPSDEWLHARIEGHQFIMAFTRYLCEYLQQQGFSAMAPALDSRMKAWQSEEKFGSTWSERHVAYACGLGTFGLSRGLITEMGMAGRFTSIITAMEFPVEPRPYGAYDEYCLLCGDCVENCPVGAISLTTGKDNVLCNAFLEKVKSEQPPWYGCGKCQVDVPCERCNPLAGSL